MPSQIDTNTDSFFLDKPCTKKQLDGDQSFGYASMQGWRKSHEDFCKHLIPFDHDSGKDWSYFAIFDGHNGIDTAKNAANLLDTYLLDAFHQYIHSPKLDNYEFYKNIQTKFLQLDKNLIKIVKDESGSVCIASLIGPKDIYLINVGDSRAIIISNDGEVLAFTKDHKPSVRKEQERIYRAGGHITQIVNDVLRVENQLAMTRTLGDYSLDKNIVPATPDIIQYPKDSSTAFLILACDGIWDVMNNEQVARFVSQRTSTTRLDNIASQLLDECLQKQSTDNMTVYIVKLHD